MTLYDQLLAWIETNDPPQPLPEPLASQILAVLNLRNAKHYSTCQCNSLRPIMPTGPEGAKRARSWHHDTLLPENDLPTGANDAGSD